MLLKQKLEIGEISRYCWLQDENMLADILTKERKEKFGLDDLLKENKLSVLKTEDNCVKCEEGEIMITGRKLRDKLTPKKKIPFWKATTPKVSKSLPSSSKKKTTPTARETSSNSNEEGGGEKGPGECQE